MTITEHTNGTEVTTVTNQLPHLAGRTFITDAGLETWLVFLQGIELPEFASFPLLDTEHGRDLLDAYFSHYLEIAQRHDTGIVLDTATWRANPDWGGRLGYDPDQLVAINERAVAYALRLSAERPEVPAVVNGVIGPRGDGYAVGETMSAGEAASYHSLQARAFAGAGAHMVSAVTMTYVDEAIGITRAVQEEGLPVCVSFTVETDGRLPSGETLAGAIEAVDAATDAGPAYYMLNCAHPSHFEHVLDADAGWLQRIKAIRANASRMSHDELDEAEELDRGNPEELAGDYARLRAIIPDLRVVGGCCGTDHEHIARIAAAVV